MRIELKPGEIVKVYGMDVSVKERLPNSDVFQGNVVKTGQLIHFYFAPMLVREPERLLPRLIWMVGFCVLILFCSLFMGDILAYLNGTKFFGIPIGKALLGEAVGLATLVWWMRK